MNYIKEQLALTLFDLIKTREFSDISISELVNKAGVGRASFYRKYTCKEDVLSQYIIEKLEQWKKDFDANPSGDFVVSLFNYFYENKDFVKVLFSQIWGSEQRQVLLRDAIKRYVDSIEMIIKEGIENNEIKAQDPSVLAHLFFGSITSTAMYDLINSDKNVDLDIIINTTLEFSLRGINANLK